ncbi:MAG TPA: hypothetical protein VFD43_08200 [Planctomycetota bacterium]|nr:hypothetical protein [Planctomycetota bacterium]
MNHDDIREVAVVLPLEDVARLLVVSGADGTTLAGPVDLHDPGAFPHPADPEIAVTLDPARPDRSLLLVALPYAESRRGMVMALGLSKLEQRYVIEGDRRQVFGAGLTAGPDWDGDGWCDFALIAQGLSGEEGQRITHGFVSVRSGATGAEIVRVADESPRIGAICSIAAGEGSNRLLVASTLGTADGLATLLRAFELPAGATSWTVQVNGSGVPMAASQASSPGTGPGPLLVGVPYPGDRDAEDRWVPRVGHVLVASGDDGRVLRRLNGPVYGFGTSVLSCPDATADGVGEIVVGTHSGGWLQRDVFEPLALIDGASGQQLTAITKDTGKETWGAVLVSTGGSTRSRTFVISAVRSPGLVELHGLRIDGPVGEEPAQK